MSPAERGYGTTDILEVYGGRITQPTLHAWTRDHLLVPSIVQSAGQGRANIYSRFDVFLIGVMLALREMGGPLEEVARIVKLLCETLDGDVNKLNRNRFLFYPKKGEPCLVGRSQLADKMIECEGGMCLDLVGLAEKVYAVLSARGVAN